MFSDLAVAAGDVADGVSSDVAIRAGNLGKRYHIYSKPHHRLIQGLTRRRKLYKEFWALRAASFEIRRGEAVGFIGRNGAGKSTLLQMLCGIVSPTEGTVEVNGRIAALLELGAGFNPEFSGRENVLLKGSLLGMSRAQLKMRMPDILAFAEIGEHIDQPVKTYSSGMFVRLAFAVSVHCEPDILVIDEALAVGDIYFQRKCHRKIEQLRESGCTLLFVTHSTEALARLCKRGIMLEDGRIVFDGPVKEATATYLTLVFGVPATARSGTADHKPLEMDMGVKGLRERMLAAGPDDVFARRSGYNRGEVRLGTGEALVADFAFEGMAGQAPVLSPDEKVSLLVKYVARESVDRVVLGMQIRRLDGTLVCSTNTFYQQSDPLSLDAGQILIGRFRLRNVLLPGKYFLTLGISRIAPVGRAFQAIDRRMDAVIISVLGDDRKGHGVADLGITIEAPAR